MWVYQSSDEKAIAPGAGLRTETDGVTALKETLHFSEEDTPPRAALKEAAGTAIPFAQAERARKTAPRLTPNAPQPAPRVTGKGSEAVSAASGTAAPRASLRRHSVRSARAAADVDVYFLAGAYSLGAVLAGVLRALYTEPEQAFVRYYTAAWQELYLTGQPLHLFLSQYGGAVLCLTLVLVLGLCAFGAPLICLLATLYGMGTGTLCLEQFLSGAWRVPALSVPLFALPAAALACCLCLFGAQAVKISLRLGRSAFTKKEPEAVAFSARMLLARYLFFCVVLALFCGFAAACSGLAEWMLRA